MALLSHVVAFAQLELVFGWLSVPSRWHWQFALVLALSFSVTLGGYFVRDFVPRALLLIIRIGLIIFLSAPEGGLIFIELTLVAGLLVEAGLSFGFPRNVILSAIALLVLVASPRSSDIWQVVIPPRAPYAMLFVAFYGAVLILLVTVLNFQLNRLSRQKAVVDRANEASIELARVNVELQNYSITAEQQAHANERKRLTHEIHDTVGYALVNQVMMMESAIRVAGTDPVELKEILAQARQHAQEALQEVRKSLRLLNSIEGEGNGETGIPRIRKLARAFEKTALHVSVDFGNLIEALPDAVDLVAFHFVQEGITNSILHGKASRVDVSFFRADGYLIVSISDDGKGSDEIVPGIGLSGLRDEIERMGGELKLSSSNFGFHLTARVPVAFEGAPT